MDDGPNPINGLTNAPEWSGTNITLVCREVGDDLHSLYPEEHDIVSRSAAPRQQTFASGRRCARTAMAEAGVPAAPLLRSADGGVQWPPGVIGSISHTRDWAVAAVAIRGLCRAVSLGVDLECIQRLESGVLELVATAAERQELAEAGQEDWHGTALFSFKESLYKCLRPQCSRFIHFDEVEVREIVGGRPRLSLCSEDLQQRFDTERLHLRMAITPAHVFTLAWLEESG